MSTLSTTTRIKYYGQTTYLQQWYPVEYQVRFKRNTETRYDTIKNYYTNIMWSIDEHVSKWPTLAISDQKLQRDGFCTKHRLGLTNYRTNWWDLITVKFKQNDRSYTMTTMIIIITTELLQLKYHIIV